MKIIHLQETEMHNISFEKKLWNNDQTNWSESVIGGFYAFETSVSSNAGRFAVVVGHSWWV